MPANIRDESRPKSEGVPPDLFAYFDHVETIHHIQAAIESNGPGTRFLTANRSPPQAVQEYALDDIRPTIAEGLGVDTDRAHVPALREITTCLTGRELGLSVLKYH